MREDQTQDEEFRESSVWEFQRFREELFLPRFRTKLAGDEQLKDRQYVSNSLSGNERNRMYLGASSGFVDVTLVSGTDDLSDGRSFGLIDYDRDGWLDIALMTLNRPRFKLFQNQMRDRFPKNRPFQFRLVGGQSSAKPSSELSNRDAIGAQVRVQFKSGRGLIMHKQCGEGFASQNSEVLSIGTPENDEVVKLEIRWPSGKVTQIDSPAASSVLTIREVPESP